MRLPITSLPFAQAIAQTSGGIVETSDAPPYVVVADYITIDLDACAVAVGRPLTGAEQTMLQCRNLGIRALVVHRFRQFIFLTTARGRSILTFTLPLPMVDTIKRIAYHEHRTIGQVVTMALDYYLTTFGYTDPVVRATLDECYEAMHYERGERAVLGLLTHPETRDPYAQFAIPREMTPAVRPRRLEHLDHARP